MSTAIQTSLFNQVVFTTGESCFIHLEQGDWIVTVRGRPTLIDYRGNAYAITKGYFPLSSTGFYSSCIYRNIPKWDSFMLEDVARENDNRRAEHLRAVKKYYKHADAKYWGNVASGLAYYAPDNERGNILSLALDCFKHAGWSTGVKAINSAFADKWSELKKCCDHVFISPREAL